jgi:hypothetical protein
MNSAGYPGWNVDALSGNVAVSTREHRDLLMWISTSRMLASMMNDTEAKTFQAFRRERSFCAIANLARRFYV